MLITLSDSYIDNAAGKSSKPQIFTLSLKILVGNVLAFLTLWKHQLSIKTLVGKRASVSHALEIHLSNTLEENNQFKTSELESL